MGAASREDDGPRAKEAEVKPQTGAQKQHGRRSDPSMNPADTVCPTLSVDLSDEQRRVLDCLQEAGTGLTAKQLESRLPSAPGALDGALAGLLERQLVVRLNTLIPSYACRQASSRVHVD